MSKEKIKERGITLVALTVTIIVLLILAGVTITSLLGDDGIIRKAQQAANRTNEAIQNEQAELDAMLEQLNNYGNGTGTGEDETPEVPTGPNGKPLLSTVTEIQYFGHGGERPCGGLLQNTPGTQGI